MSMVRLWILADLYTRWEGGAYLVECDGEMSVDAATIDHHRPGDPGYGRPPEEQWTPAQGLTDIYGDPARGLAGGYLS